MYFRTQSNMYRLRTPVTLTILLYFAFVPAFASGIHKWVDEQGVTHYSDKAPESDIRQVSVIEIPAYYSTVSNIEEDYYSITNQWMRVHQERLELEKIKLEKAKQKAAQRPSPPQVVYVNESNENRYRVAHPFFIHNKFKNKRRKHRFFNDYGDKTFPRNRNFCPNDFQVRRGHSSRSSRSGLTLKID